MTLPISWSLTEPPFEAALRFTGWAEGGVSNRKADAGGLTNLGVTQREYNLWRARRGLPLQPVTLCTAEERRQIAQDDYWLSGSCQLMPVRLSIAHFDWCYNHGPDDTNKMLQRVVGVVDDGNIGSRTIAAIRAEDDSTLAKTYIEVRRQWYVDDANHDPIHGLPNKKGWLARCDHLIEYLGL